jgi:NAD(P)-dependent dehydrogenase (short-subunit alcohol dehydrogenase family)
MLMGDAILLNNKIIVITGASSGIGAMLAVEAAKQGAITIALLDKLVARLRIMLWMLPMPSK